MCGVIVWVCGVIVRLLLQLLLHSHGDTDLIRGVGLCNNMYPRGLE